MEEQHAATWQSAHVHGNQRTWAAWRSSVQQRAMACSNMAQHDAVCSNMVQHGEACSGIAQHAAACSVQLLPTMLMHAAAWRSVQLLHAVVRPPC
jgi:hypothetical protein